MEKYGIVPVPAAVVGVNRPSTDPCWIADDDSGWGTGADDKKSGCRRRERRRRRSAAAAGRGERDQRGRGACGAAGLKPLHGAESGGVPGNAMGEANCAASCCICGIVRVVKPWKLGHISIARAPS